MSALLDVKYALRLLAKSPAFTLLTVIMLAGGLGVSIFTYSFINTAMFKALPLEDGARIVKLYGSDGGQRRLLDALELKEIRDQATTVEQIGAYSDRNVMVSSGDVARPYSATQVEWGMFDFTHTKAAYGRALQPVDADAGAEPVVVLSHRVWKGFFDGDPNVVGRLVQIDEVSTRVVGIMPEHFGFPVSSDMWVPIDPALLQPVAIGEASLSVFARLGPQITREQADTELTAIVQRLRQQLPRDDEASVPRRPAAFVQSLQEAQVPDGLPLFIALYTLSGLILLLAATNAGNLLLARAMARRQETAIRVALGAPRGRLVGQMMWESILVCAAGGVLAILMAGWALQALDVWSKSTLAGGTAFWWNWGLDMPTMLGALVLLVFTVLVAGWLPARRASADDFNQILRDGTRGAEGRGVGRLTRALVVLQVVFISIIVFVGGVLAMASHGVTRADFGIDTSNALAAPMRLDAERYPDTVAQARYFERLRESLADDPRSRAVVVMSDLTNGEHRFAIDGEQYQFDGDYPLSYARGVAGPLERLGVQLVAGRYFDARDRADGNPVALVSQSLAQRHWPNRSAVGERVRLVNDEEPAQWATVVGVVSDTLNGSPLSKSRSYQTIYRPLSQDVSVAANVVVKYAGDESGARSAIHQAAMQVDPDTRAEQIMSFDRMLKQSAVMANTATGVLLQSGLFALLLAVTGIYGLTANSVTRRTREIGLRRAIGATDRNVMQWLMGQGGRQLFAGLAIALVFVVLLSALLSRMLVLSTATYAVIAVAVMGLIAAVVMAATFVPALRAVGAEPAAAIRHD